MIPRQLRFEHSRRLMLPLLAVLTLAASGECQDIQLPSQQQSARNAETIPLTPAPADPTSAASILMESLPADTGFWFVSTDCSPQSFSRTCPRFCPFVSRYEQCVGYQHSGFSQMLSQMEPGVPICIMIHGSFVDRPSACREAIGTWHWLRCASHGCRMQFISMSWPSYRPLSITAPFDTNQLGRRAERNGYYLAELIAQLPPECPLCLIGHSHGTRVIASGLHLLSGGDVRGIRHPYARANGRIIRTVFCAAAIDHDWLNPGHRYDRALCSTQCVLNLKNCRDPALKVYPFRLPLIARLPLGLRGLSNIDRRRLGRQQGKVRDSDVAHIVGARHFWPYYFSSPSLAAWIRNYVYFPDMQPAVHVSTADSRPSEIR